MVGGCTYWDYKTKRDRERKRRTYKYLCGFKISRSRSGVDTNGNCPACGQPHEELDPYTNDRGDAFVVCPTTNEHVHFE